jgi:hypothetical protein
LFQDRQRSYSRGTRCYAVAAIRPVCCCLESKSVDAVRGERGKTLLRRNIAGADFQAEYEGSIPFTRSSLFFASKDSSGPRRGRRMRSRPRREPARRMIKKILTLQP